MKLGIQSRMKFLIADTTDLDVIPTHRNIIQIIQIAEHTDLAKLSHTCKHGKLDTAVHRFQSPIEWLQGITELFLQLFTLVDEYDKPMLQAIGNEELQKQFRNTLKPFYGALKTMDGCIKFAMLTGVTKF